MDDVISSRVHPSRTGRSPTDRWSRLGRCQPCFSGPLSRDSGLAVLRRGSLPFNRPNSEMPKNDPILPDLCSFVYSKSG